MFRHKTFLLWLLYIVAVVTLFIGFGVTGLLPAALAHDKSFLVLGILIFYVLSEFFLAFQHIKNDKIQTKLDVMGFSQLFKDKVPFRKINDIKVENAVRGTDTVYNVFVDRLQSRNSWAAWLANILIFLGLIGTLTGVILAFWPFISVVSLTIDVAAIQSSLGAVFAAVGAAFFPSIAAAMVTVLLLINDKILKTTVDDIVNRMKLLRAA